VNDINVINEKLNTDDISLSDDIRRFPHRELIDREIGLWRQRWNRDIKRYRNPNLNRFGKRATRKKREE
jgi:hypothetical protein